MRTKMILLVTVACLLTATAFFMRDLDPAKADDIPEKYRETLQKGLDFLVKNQLPDGHWEGDEGKFPVATTALAGIALLMEKEPRRGESWGKITPTENAGHDALVGRAAAWLIEKSQAGREGLIYAGHRSESDRYMEGHSLATQLLAGVYWYKRFSKPPESTLLKCLERAAKYVEAAQTSKGGWYHTSAVEGHDLDDMLVSALQLQALAALVGVDVPISRQVSHDGAEYLTRALEVRERLLSEKQDLDLTPLAAALATQRIQERADYGNWVPDDPNEKWFKVCRDRIPLGKNFQFDRDALALYFLAMTAHQGADKTWSAYRESLLDALQAMQNKDGSWPATTGLGAGQVYTTALCCIILQSDKGSYPTTLHQYDVTIRT